MGKIAIAQGMTLRNSNLLHMCPHQMRRLDPPAVAPVIANPPRRLARTRSFDSGFQVSSWLVPLCDGVDYSALPPNLLRVSLEEASHPSSSHLVLGCLTGCLTELTS